MKGWKYIYKLILIYCIKMIKLEVHCQALCIVRSKERRGCCFESNIYDYTSKSKEYRSKPQLGISSIDYKPIAVL